MLKLSCEDRLDSILEALKFSDPVILAPTETVYGLLCDWSNESAREKIYQLKKRPANKMLAAFVPTLDSVSEMVPLIPRNARKIAERYCPGPVTLVIPDGQGSTFGFRIPDHPFILRLLKAHGKPLASTSANLSGTPAALSVEQALSTLSGAPDVIVDGGSIPEDSIASTVIQIHADDSWKILRPGPVSETDLNELLNS